MISPDFDAFDAHIAGLLRLATERHKRALAVLNERPIAPRERLLAALADFDDAILLADEVAQDIDDESLDVARDQLAGQRHALAFAIEGDPR